MISLVVNVKNEELNLEQCLKSASDLVSEIVVVDDGSTDSTIEIAKKFTNNIFKHVGNGYVEPSRNYAIEKAKSKWVLILDADETIGKELKTKLSDITRDDKVDYVKIPRLNKIFSSPIKHSGWWPDYQVRFFKKGKVKWRNEIHSQPIATGKGVELEAREELSINHENYKTISDFLIKLNSYTDIQASELVKKGEMFTLSKLIKEPSSEFTRRYFIWNGYKDGMHGLVLAVLQAFSQFVLYLKVWQLNGFQKVDEKETLTSLKKQTKEIFRDINQITNKSKIGRIKNKIITKII